MQYEEIDWAGARPCSATLAVEQKLTISIGKLVGGSTSIIRGNRDRPEYIKQSAYAMQIKNARDGHVVLYDVAARRGWLVDGASALLHLVRTQVVREPYGQSGSLFNNLMFNDSTFCHPEIDGGPNAAADILTEEGNMKHIILREFDSYVEEGTSLPRLEAIPLPGEHSSKELNNPLQNAVPKSGEGRKAIYKITCMRELVSQTWSTLERIYDRQTEIATTHTTKELQNPFQTTLEGYEFMDIVSGEHTLHRRTINLQSNGTAWVDLARRMNAVVLFGQHFGHIYKPADKVGKLICNKWETVPPGHEFLAAPISLLKEIKLRNWRKGKVAKVSSEITEGLFWSLSKDAFKTCGPDCKHTFSRVQQIRCSTSEGMLTKTSSGRDDPQEFNNFADIHGAVLFGNNSNFDPSKLKPWSPKEGHAEGYDYDSGVGSSIQDSSHAISSTASSGGMELDSQASPPSTCSTIPSPSQSDQIERTDLTTQDDSTSTQVLRTKRKHIAALLNRLYQTRMMLSHSNGGVKR
jgi:hypothetical protein